MKSTNQFYLKLSQESLSNSKTWLEEANHLLFERRSYGHSTTLSLFSMEETVKSWICWSVGIGLMSPNDKYLKEVFRSHGSKMAALIFYWIVANAPILSQSFQKELSEDDKKQLESLMKQINIDKISNDLVYLRMKGLYVDYKKNVIISPNEITKDDADGFFLDAFRFYKYMEIILNSYEKLDDEKKREFMA